MTYNRRATISTILALALGVTSVAAGLQASSHLLLVTHWNYSGMPNGSAGKWLGLSMGPLLALMGALPLHGRAWLQWPHDGLARSDGLLSRVWLAILAVASSVELAMLAQALAWRLSAEHVMVAGFGVAIALIGDGLGKSRRMARVGLRTRSTLASEDAWSAGHRLAGMVTLAAGAAVVVVAGLNASPSVLTTVLIAALAVAGVGAVAGSKRAAKVSSIR